MKGVLGRDEILPLVLALDSKHIVIQAPPYLRSQYYNCKGSLSIMLLAVVSANYCFQVNDNGASGNESKAGTLCELA